MKAIAPGSIMTPMVEGSLKQIDADNGEEVGREFVSSSPMKRFGRPRRWAPSSPFCCPARRRSSMPPSRRSTEVRSEKY
ncbi:hypothetical protein QSJ19_07815 [Gordonia sp. ABSL11-1]|uniref:hypothetical protein n=1 Tax=Gordonia sp. ABSL11-1 TaxID=3053924 RepID=UPI0025740693|nr:hypothetical protein [Gordonia sp. ABSL11-1]MDL9945499.1 hypothetical protein [Gordonia sp. ABSL11-1]